jgi:hypothetical protein
MTSRPNDREGTLSGTVVCICGNALESQSPEFTRIVRDLSTLGESVHIEVHFASDGGATQGNILLKQTDAACERYEDYGK